jgi:hypothetical protein
MTAVTSDNILGISASAVLSKLDIDLKVGTEVILFLFSKGWHFGEFDVGLPIYFLTLPINLNKGSIEDVADEQVPA